MEANKVGEWQAEADFCVALSCGLNKQSDEGLIFPVNWSAIDKHRRLGGGDPTGKSFRLVRACVRAVPLPSEIQVKN